MRSSLSESFLALGDSTRLAVVDLLRRKPRRPSDIADALSMSRPTTSKHLAVLRRAGLVEETEGDEEDARVRVYQLRPEPFAHLRGWLEEVEAFWSQQLGSFKAHAERKARGRGR